MKPIVTINGAWSEQANAWVSETLCLTGDCWLEVELPSKGRLVIKKSEKVIDTLIRLREKKVVVTVSVSEISRDLS